MIQVEGVFKALERLGILKVLDFLRAWDLLMVLRSTHFIAAGAGVALIGFPGNPGRKRHLWRLRVFNCLVFVKGSKVQATFPLGLILNKLFLFNELSCPVSKDFYGHFMIKRKKKELEGIGVVF